jgi:hypothetical protein
LPRDALEMTAPSATAAQTGYGHGIVDEAMQWNRDREGSSIESGSESGNAPSATESSGQSSRGLDPSTLYFKKEDTILLVDGESSEGMGADQTRLIRGDTCGLSLRHSARSSRREMGSRRSRRVSGSCRTSL